MTTQCPETTVDRPAWDRAHLRQALSTAQYQAARGSRRLGLSRADRDDLCQDILLVMVQRSRHFDPERGAWSTFLGVLARNVVADRARAERAGRAPAFLALDLDAFPNGCSATLQDHHDSSLALDLQRLADELPPTPRSILRLLGAEGDVPNAQRASPLSLPAFYRCIADLRCWLHATGMRPHRCQTRKPG